MKENAEFICPLCQRENRCGINNETACWCLTAKVPKALIRQLPTSKQGKACICAKCIAAFNTNLAYEAK
ncbi:cysteine-rich CWC family protein [Thalassotalea sediminis]|uniref:cysteine-rich CWC family protein n=1 Tax=Thalassotalea sediminis TaxID=1759089 RepID=UPI003305CD50